MIHQSQIAALLDDILKFKKEHPSEKFPLAFYLRSRGEQPVLQHLNFAIVDKTVTMTPMQRMDKSLTSITKVARRTTLLNDIDFSHCEIKNCQFDECDLSGSIWNDVSICDSSFNNTVINHALLHGVCVKNSQFTQTSFDYSTFDALQFEESHFIHSAFNYLNKIHKVQFNNCSIQQTSMLGGIRAEGLVIKSEKECGLLTDQKINVMPSKKETEQPAILVCWNNVTPQWSATLAEKMLSAHDMYSVRMDMTPKVDAPSLDKELNELNHLTQKKLLQLKERMLEKSTTNFDLNWKKRGLSFPLLMIQIMREKNTKNPERFPQMAALYQHAKTIFDKIDGILLTGGQDIDPRFYGAERHLKTGFLPYPEHHEFHDIRRDVLEFCLVYMQQRAFAPKPLFGICRGSQVIAAAYGATFYQELDSPERRQYFVEAIQPNNINKIPAFNSTRRAVLTVTEQEKHNVIYMHHQGYDLGKAHGIDTIASMKTSGGTVIDTVGESLTQHITLTQPHSEYYLDKEEKGTNGFSSQVSASLADSIFKQFQGQVFTYQQNQLLNHSLRNRFFIPKGHELSAPSENIVEFGTVEQLMGL